MMKKNAKLYCLYVEGCTKPICIYKSFAWLMRQLNYLNEYTGLSMAWYTVSVDNSIIGHYTVYFDHDKGFQTMEFSLDNLE